MVLDNSGMSEHDTAAPTAEPTDEGHDTGQATDPAQSGQEAPDAAAEAKAGREAARHWVRLRDAEAQRDAITSERDALRERVDAFERTEVEWIAANTGMATPADVWAITSLEDFRADGVLDADATRERVTMILSERPTWRASTPDLGAGARGGIGTARRPEFSRLFEGASRALRSGPAAALRHDRLCGAADVAAVRGTGRGADP